MTKHSLTKDLISDLFYYNDGYLYRKTRPSQNTKINERVGSLGKDGYLRVAINYKHYLVHRIIYMLHFGYLPDIVDHLNRDTLDNRIENLRPATRSENAFNSVAHKDSTVKIKGITWREDLKKYRVRICKDYKQYHIGVFNTLEDAKAASTTARKILHKEYSLD